MEHLPSPAREAAVRRYPFAISDQLFAVLGALADFILIVAASIGVSWLYHWFIYGSYGVGQHYLAAGLLIAAIYVPLRVARGQYLVTTLLSEGRNVESMFAAWNYAFLTLLIMSFLVKETGAFSRAAVALIYVAGFGALLALREGMFHLARHGFRYGILLGKPTMLIGDKVALRHFHQSFRPSSFGLRIVDEVALSRGEEDRPAMVERLKRATARARALRVEEVFILTPLTNRALIDEAAAMFIELPVSVHLDADDILGSFRDARIQRFGPLASLELIRPPLSPWAHWAKRGLDILGAGVGLVVLSPLMLLAALAIKLDSPGPVFFRQARQGFNNRPFHIWKFRTMTVMEDEGPVRQARRGDPRITRVGRVLRRFSIDELPQLVNVLKGDMSLVGPRPHAMDHDNAFERKVRRYARRHKVLPGITGWAQVNGYRGETDTDEKLLKRVEYDLEYIDRWSIWFDIYIIALTILSPRTWRNAY